MLRKIIFVFFCMFCFIYTGNSPTKVAAFTKSPLTKNSEQWNLEIREAKNKLGSSKAKADIYDIYALNVENIGKTVYNVQIEVYRNDEDSPTLHEIVGSSSPTPTMPTVKRFSYTNLPVSVKATGITIIITWQTELPRSLKEGLKIDARKHREIFVFGVPPHPST